MTVNIENVYKLVYDIITDAFMTPALVGTLTDQTCTIWQQDCDRFVTLVSKTTTL